MWKSLIPIVLLAVISQSRPVHADVLIDSATVNAMLNDYSQLNILPFLLTPPVSPAYDCGVGNLGNEDGTWAVTEAMVETESSPPTPQTNLEKINSLLNVAWLTGMTVRIEGVEYDGATLVCEPEYIFLHNPTP